MSAKRSAPATRPSTRKKASAKKAAAKPRSKKASARSGAAKGTPRKAPARKPVSASKGLEQVLAHAQEETRRQLSEAIEKQKKTGQGLVEILRHDVDREMFRKIWSFLNRPIGRQAGEEKKQVKDVLLEGGFITPDEWSDAQASGEAYDPSLGQALVDSGYVSHEQFDEAMAQQERSGQSFWRILVNRGYATPKQIADARKFRQEAYPTLGEAALAQAVLRTGLVAKAQVDKALQAKGKGEGKSLLQALLDAGAARKQELGQAAARELGVEYVDFKKAEVQREALDLLPEHLAEQHLMLPVSVADSRVCLAMANPQDVAAREMFRMMVNMEVEPALAFEEDVREAVQRLYRSPPPPAGRRLPGALERLKARLHGAAAMDDAMVSMAESAGIINLVASVVEGAIHSRATDIHLEPQANELRVRYRIDGLLYDIMNLPERLMPGVISRVKVLAGMDITEKRRPQDGHFVIEVMEKNYDLRVASLPTVLGEKVVLRLLNPEDVFRGLRELGLEPDQLETMEDAIVQPYGMVLATGPIGSGKTTTLYAALSQIDILSQNVVTIEDPVEYELPGINQVQVDLRVARTFATMLRSVVRQDANVMMVGEIRDSDTAEVAVRAALTGHLVFSTLHTNDAVGAVDTLKHLGVPPFLIVSSLVLVAAQRLVRRVCPRCAEAHKPDAATLRAVGLTPQKARGKNFARGKGCDACYQTGYRGRTGIYELFQPDDEAKRMVLAGASRAELLGREKKQGMATLADSGMRKAEAGITSIEELMRVTVF